MLAAGVSVCAEAKERADSSKVAQRAAGFAISLMEQKSNPGRETSYAHAVPNDSSRNPLLAIDSLTVAFRGKPVLRELSLSIEPGQVLGLVGESGSGKSVTSLAI